MSKLTACTCSLFFFGTYGDDGSAESFADYNTGCTQTTTRLFAQGHDAKLVGFLVRAELAGEEIATVQGGLRVTFGGAAEAAATISEALANKAEAQYSAALARIAKKESKPAKKAKGRDAIVKAVEAKVVPVSRETKIKVGRWTYAATIDLATGQATYSSKLGAVKTAEVGQYSEV